MQIKPTPDADYLRSRLDYDLKTGNLAWKPNSSAPAKWNTRYAGTVAGYMMKTGYVLLALDGERWLAHRLIWKMMTGDDASSEIDHMNTIPFDNRWENLRMATRSQNECNKIHKSQARGVRKHGKNWAARIRKDGIQIDLGVFVTREDAIEAYRRAALQLHGEYVHESVCKIAPLGRDPVKSKGLKSVTGVRGVSPFGRKYRARLNRNGLTTEIGLFDTVEQASIALTRAKAET